MNFLKFQAATLHEAINPSLARSADLDRIEELLREAGAVRNRIIRSYRAGRLHRREVHWDLPGLFRLGLGG
jgi:hypothetical protein